MKIDNEKLTRFVRAKLNEHGVDDLLKGTDAVVYGGYLRDAVREFHNPDLTAGYKDIDILAIGRIGADTISSRLSKKVVFNESTLYQAKNIIARTERHEGTIFQVIIPQMTYLLEKEQMDALQRGQDVNKWLSLGIKKFIQNVDIFCCGLAYSNGTLYEAVATAYEDCKNNTLRINEGADMLFEDRTNGRIIKLEARGWHYDWPEKEEEKPEGGTIDFADIL